MPAFASHRGRRAVCAVLAALAVTSAGCAAEPGDDPRDILPPSGQGEYSVSYIGSTHDTTWHYTPRAKLDRLGCIDLFNLAFQAAEAVRLGTGVYPLLTIHDDFVPGTVVVHTLHNGYAQEVHGTLTVVWASERQLGGRFEFSSPTEGQLPAEFTVRIEGSFLAERAADSTDTC